MEEVKGFGGKLLLNHSRYIKTVEEHEKDCLNFINKSLDYEFNVNKISPSTPIMFFGTSMGGLTATYLALKHPSIAKGVALGCPALSAPVLFIISH